MDRTRRDLVFALTAAGAAGRSLDAAPPAVPPLGGATVSGLSSGAHVPSLKFVYECDVSIVEPLDFGATAEGHRRVIPISGGTFAGPDIRGVVVSGGADWNLTRADGAHSVEASYYLRTDDGVMIRITNKGVGTAAQRHEPATSEPFFMYTVPSFEAPNGKYEWMNQSVFVGTLGARENAHNSVLIRVFMLV